MKDSTGRRRDVYAATHLIVWAAEITDIRFPHQRRGAPTAYTARLHFGPDDFLEVDSDWLAREDVVPGDYVMWGLDRWPRFIKKKAFEPLYKKVETSTIKEPCPVP